MNLKLFFVFISSLCILNCTGAQEFNSSSENDEADLSENQSTSSSVSGNQGSVYPVMKVIEHINKQEISSSDSIFFGSNDEIHTNIYSAAGYVETKEIDKDGDGNIDKKWHVTFDKGHSIISPNILAYEEDSDGDGNIDRMETYENKYDQLGRIIQSKIKINYDNDSFSNFMTVKYSMNSAGDTTVEETYSVDEQDSPFLYQTFTYDFHSKLKKAVILKSSSGDINSEKNINVTHSYEYDDKDRLLRITTKRVNQYPYEENQFYVYGDMNKKKDATSVMVTTSNRTSQYRTGSGYVWKTEYQLYSKKYFYRDGSELTYTDFDDDGIPTFFDCDDDSSENDQVKLNDVCFLDQQMDGILDPGDLEVNIEPISDVSSDYYLKKSFSKQDQKKKHITPFNRLR